MTDKPTLSRRALIGGSAASVAGLGLGGVGGWQAHAASSRSDQERGWGSGSVVPFYGTHQAALVHPPAAHARFLTFDLREGVDASGIRRMLRVLTEDAARLAAGIPPLADSEPELAVIPASLTFLVGFGPELVRRVKPSARPAWLEALPSFSVDQLKPALTGGDLLVAVHADDPVTVAHATRVVTRQLASYVQLRWSLDGFRRARGSDQSGRTMRNLFGQVDGTAGPKVGEEAFDRAVLGAGREGVLPGWLEGGTGYVLRVIEMDLDTWDQVDRPDREKAVGRTLDTGAPLTGGSEDSPADFGARDALGLPVIPDFAHMRRARAAEVDEVIFRRGYNYETPQSVEAPATAGLLFEAFAADPTAQFVPIQRRLAELDMMNLWTTPIGSAVYAIPPGCQPGGYIGDTLV